MNLPRSPLYKGKLCKDLYVCDLLLKMSTEPKAINVFGIFEVNRKYRQFQARPPFYSIQASLYGVEFAYRAAVEAKLVRGRDDGPFCIPSLGKATELLSCNNGE